MSPIALDANLAYPSGVSLSSDETLLYVCDTANHKVKRVNLTDGSITTIAGGSKLGYNGDYIEATSALLHSPYSVTENNGEVYIAVSTINTLVNTNGLQDFGNNRIRKILMNGTIITVAGNDGFGYDGDGVDATMTPLGSPTHVAIFNNELFIAVSTTY